MTCKQSNYFPQILSNECRLGRIDREPLDASPGHGAAQLARPHDPVPNNERLPRVGQPPAGPRGRLYHQPQHHEPGADPHANGRDAGAVSRPDGSGRRCPAEHCVRHVRLHQRWPHAAPQRHHAQVARLRLIASRAADDDGATTLFVRPAWFCLNFSLAAHRVFCFLQFFDRCQSGWCLILRGKLVFHPM
jgi:hypothetical protein